MQTSKTFHIGENNGVPFGELTRMCDTLQAPGVCTATLGLSRSDRSNDAGPNGRNGNRTTTNNGQSSFGFTFD